MLAQRWCTVCIPRGVEYQIVNDAPPIRMSYDEIVWPDFVRSPGEDDGGQSVLFEEAPITVSGNSILKNYSGLAEEFAERNEICYRSEESRFYIYDDDRGVWENLNPITMNEHLRMFLLTLGDELLDGQNRLKFGAMVVPHFVRQVVDFLKGMTEMACEFDVDSNLVHATSGVIRITESGLIVPLPHAPEHYIRNAHNFRFVRTPRWTSLAKGLLRLGGFKKDPLELSLWQRPTKFLKYLCSMLDPEDVELLQLWIGSVLLGGNRHQKIFVLSGPSGCGKSQLSVVIEALVGEEKHWHPAGKPPERTVRDIGLHRQAIARRGGCSAGFLERKTS